MSVGNEKMLHVKTSDDPDELRIGAILTRAGRLRKEDASKVLEHQRRHNIRFGDAAIQLGLLQEGDVRFALAHQFNHAYVDSGTSKISADVIAAYEPESPKVEAIRALRSELMVRWFGATASSNKTLAIVGQDSRAGRSWLAANLAVTFSQLGKNTVLIDSDLRGSSQHRLFGLDNGQGLSELLCGRVPLAGVLKRNRLLQKLVVITAGATPPNPQEVLARDEFERLLAVLKSSADIVILDTPAGRQCADGQTIAIRAKGAVIVAQRDVSRPAMLSGFARTLQAASVEIVASVLMDS